MSSLDQDFEELRRRVRHGRDLNSASYEPIFYLVFHPREMLTVKRMMDKWRIRFEQDGWNVHIFSLAEQIGSILRENDLRDVWIMSEEDDPLNFPEYAKTMGKALTEDKSLENALHSKLAGLSEKNRDLLLVTDLEALHPFLRIGAIETRLQGQFNVPTIFFYPGERCGKTRLSFLGFYPEDGNYRSVHVGG